MVPARPLGAIRVAFWEFSQQRPAEALDRFFQSSGALRQRLEAADWSANLKQYLDPTAYAARKAEALETEVSDAWVKSLRRP